MKKVLKPKMSGFKKKIRPTQFDTKKTKKRKSGKKEMFPEKKLENQFFFP